MTAPMDRISSGESQTISEGGVVTILPMIAGGTPSCLRTRAMMTVAAVEFGVSLPDLSDAPCTPSREPWLTNFSLPAAKAMKQAEAQVPPAATDVAILAC